MKGMTNAQKDTSDLATKSEVALKADMSVLEAKADQSALNATNTEVAKKANQSDLSALQTRMTTAESDIDALQQSSGTSIIGGTGISIGADGKTINHSNSISAGSVGSATQVPVLRFDAQGHCTSKSYETIYPPTTSGSAGQVWTSDGSGQGHWANPSTPNIVINNIEKFYDKEGTRIRAVAVTYSITNHTGGATITTTYLYDPSDDDSYAGIWKGRVIDTTAANRIVEFDESSSYTTRTDSISNSNLIQGVLTIGIKGIAYTNTQVKGISITVGNTSVGII